MHRKHSSYLATQSMPNTTNAGAEHKQGSTLDYVQGRNKTKVEDNSGDNGKKITRNAGGEGRGTQEDQKLSETRYKGKTK